MIRSSRYKSLRFPCRVCTWIAPILASTVKFIVLAHHKISCNTCEVEQNSKPCHLQSLKPNPKLLTTKRNSSLVSASFFPPQQTHTRKELKADTLLAQLEISVRHQFKPFWANWLRFATANDAVRPPLRWFASIVNMAESTSSPATWETSTSCSRPENSSQNSYRPLRKTPGLWRRRRSSGEFCGVLLLSTLRGSWRICKCWCGSCRSVFLNSKILLAKWVRMMQLYDGNVSWHSIESQFVEQLLFIQQRAEAINLSSDEDKRKLTLKMHEYRLIDS